MQKKVFVRQEHIEEGEKLRYSLSQLRSENCPVALALKDAGFENVKVWSGGWRFLKDDARITGTFSHKVTAFINGVDASKEGKPFSFIARY